MTGGEVFELVGDLSPADLARRLAWPPRLVRELIDDGTVTRTATGWRVDSAALSRRWADAQWNPATEHDAESPPGSKTAQTAGTARTDELNDGES